MQTPTHLPAPFTPHLTPPTGPTGAIGPTDPASPLHLAAELRLPTNWLDYLILGIYFVVVLGIGFAARRSVKTSLDFFLSGRSLPAWVTGLAFVAANLGATEILGMAANSAQYGVYTTHWYWIGAIPAMVFLGLVMMPFYYGSKVRSVPEFLLLRFDKAAHLLSSILFACAAILIAGVNLYALAIVVEALLGWPEWVAIVVAGFFVLAYITLGGLSSAIYNEVLQFFVILAALIPITVLGLRSVGGWDGLSHSLTESRGADFMTSWGGTGIGSDNPLGANWLTIVLGLGFVLSFGYWTTNFAEVQRALSAKNLSAAQRTPLIAAYPKIFIVFLVMIPGLVAAVLVPQIGTPESDLQYNDAIPYLMSQLLPNGVLGIAVTGLLAAFMAGMAANISSFNTVFTTDIWARYVVQEEVSALQTKSATAARLFDIRRLIGGLFVVYGVIVTIAGITASDADIDRAEGLNINLWTGLAMLALGLFFLVWLKLRPTAPPPPDVTDASALTRPHSSGDTVPPTGPARSSSPVRAASAAASSREPTPSFIRTRCTCVRAVDGAMPMPAAISRVSSPSATLTRTSTSRGVSIRSSRWPSSSGWTAGFSSSPNAPCSSCGATAASPARAFMIARSTPSMRSSCRT